MDTRKSGVTAEMSTKPDSKETTSVAAAAAGELPNNTSIFFVIVAASVAVGLLIELSNPGVNDNDLTEFNDIPRNKYWVFSVDKDVENKNGLLKHVHLVLERIGYEISTNKTPWNLLWSHDYPFKTLYPHLHRLQPHQKVNHFPGSGFITHKVDLATSKLKHIPKAFKLPQDKKAFVEYAKQKDSAMFLEKHNQHRGVLLKNVTEIDLSSGESFVQEYVQKPFLVDGYKFDIGVYVVLTSVNPLRAYWYKGDVLFRYCVEKYYPFDPKILDKYVIGDDYRPTWEVPSLSHPYSTLGYSMKDSFDIYVRSQGKDPIKIWDEVMAAITDVFLAKEHHIIEASHHEQRGRKPETYVEILFLQLKNYPSSENFFELMRYDLILDEELNVYLLEANMSPNLSSAHYPPNQLLYEQVLYSLFSVTGVATDAVRRWGSNLKEQTASMSMVSSWKNIAVNVMDCATTCRESCAAAEVCALCRPCMSPNLRHSLLRAHREFLHRGDFKRLFPPAMNPGAGYENIRSSNLSVINKQQYMWYQEKCDIDVTWCSA